VYKRTLTENGQLSAIFIVNSSDGSIREVFLKNNNDAKGIAENIAGSTVNSFKNLMRTQCGAFLIKDHYGIEKKRIIKYSGPIPAGGGQARIVPNEDQKFDFQKSSLQYRCNGFGPLSHYSPPGHNIYAQSVGEVKASFPQRSLVGAKG
jgi:hypothetical protein